MKVMHNFSLFWYSICLFKCQFNWNTLEDEQKKGDNSRNTKKSLLILLLF